jgi:hypothetical protein
MADELDTDATQAEPSTSPDTAEAEIAEPTEAPLSKEEQDAKVRAYWEERKAKGQDLVERSRRSWSALQGWGEIETQEQWDRLSERAIEDWHSGAMLVKLMGAERYLDPERMALLQWLWWHFVTEHQPEGPAEYMAIAGAIIAFHHSLRVNEFAGNLATRAEYEVFDTTPPVVRVAVAEDKYGERRAASRVEGTEVLRALGREALPLLDRCQRMVARNLKLLDQLQQSRRARGMPSGAGGVADTTPSGVPVGTRPVPLAKHRGRTRAV